MRVLVADWVLDWRGAEPQAIEVARFDLENERHLTMLVLCAGTGRFEEACVECDCIEAYETFRGLVGGTGGATLADPSRFQGRRLYRAGYEVYAAGEDVVYFLNPVARPELFLAVDDAAYVAEFS